jgi:hypothetical protein
MLRIVQSHERSDGPHARLKGAALLRHGGVQPQYQQEARCPRLKVLHTLLKHFEANLPMGG